MKRILSILLAVCMLIGMFPAINAVATDYVTYTYDFRSTATGGVVGVPTIDSYDKTTSQGKWMYYGMSDDLATLYQGSYGYNRTMTYGFQVQATAVGMYTQVKLNVPKSGAYIPTLTYFNNNAASIDVEVFLAPVSAADKFAAEYKLGNVNQRGAAANNEGTVSFNAITTTETEYVLSFRIGTHVGNIAPAQFELKETDAPKKNISYTFDMSVTGNAVVQMPTLTDYDIPGGRNWKHFTTDIGGNKRSLGECINLVPSAYGQYQSLTLAEIPAGTYEISYEYATRTDGGTGNVYLAPASDASNFMAEKYLLGLVDYYSASNTTAAAPKKDGNVEFGKITVPEDGEYIISFKNVSKNASATGLSMNPSKLTLTECEPDAPVELASEYTYKLGQANDAGGLVQVPTVTEYVAKGGSNGEWKYYGMDSSLAALQETNARTVEINQSYGAYMSIGFNTVGQYLQLMLKLPNTGSYFVPTVNTYTGGYSTAVNMYVAPKGASDPMDKKYLVGAFDARNATTELQGFETDETATEYIVTFEDATTGNGHNARLLSLNFKETEKPAEEPEIEQKDYYKFDFGYKSGNTQFNVGIPTLDTYEKTGRNWKYCNMDASLYTKYENNGTPKITHARTLTGCLNITPSDASGQWLSLTLKDIYKGEYRVLLDFATHKSGGIGDIYLAPASVAESERTSAEYKLGSVDYYAKDAAFDIGNRVALGSVKLDASGDYVITFKSSGTKQAASTGYLMNPSALTLDATPLVLDSVSASVSKSILAPEETANIELSGKYTDTTDADLSNADVTFESSDDNIAKVDENGKITAVSSGIATIKVTVVFGNVTKEASIAVRVESEGELPFTGISRKIDFTLGQWSYEGSDIRPIKYADTGDIWEFAGNHESLDDASAATLRNSLTYGIQAQTSQTGQWFSIKFKANEDDVGKMTLTLNYGGYRYGCIGNFYLAPAELDDELWRNDVFKLGEIDCYADSDTVLSRNASFDVEIPEVGEYVMTFEVKERAGAYTMYLGYVILDGTDGVSLSAHSAKSGMQIGETTTIGYTAKRDGEKITLPDATVSYVNKTPDTIDVSDDGIITGKALGKGVVEVAVTSLGTTWKTELTVHIGTAKRGPTYYTYEKRANAVENASKYDWAKSQKETAVKIADSLLDKEDILWELIPQEGIPRSMAVGYMDDPEMYNCRYCGVNLRQNYSMMPYTVNAVNHPWKIQCPDCKRFFPSNDFGSFYKLGIDENGNFSHKLAHEKNAELVANGEEGYLVNKLYPEIGTENHPDTVKFTEGETTLGWGVDDGFGYLPGRTYPNGVEECHAYIAFYNHCAIWMGPTMTQYPSSLVGGKLAALRDAYLYTGDEKYGRLGAIIIDRVADVYPEYSLPQYGRLRGTNRQYYNSHGLSDEGKAIGRIWETDLARSMALSYDAFWPMMEDERVIAFLSEKAEEYNLENPKTDAALIRGNCEDGILRAIFEGCKTADIYGNFGMHQAALAAAAVVLDSQPETKEWIDWIMQDGVKTVGKSTGGNVNSQIYSLVDRDGHGNESSPEYNGLWISRTLEFAEYLYDYDGYTEANLYANPRFLKMMKAQGDIIMNSNTAPQIGDAASAGAIATNFTAENMLKEYIRTGDTELGQLAYFANGNSTDDMHADIFTKNPENVKKEIQGIIDTYGEYDFGKTVNLTGYGLAMLRDGKLYSNAITTSGANTNTQRAFWIYSGSGGTSHQHSDALNLGIEAFGLNFAPDLGYPEDTGYNRNRAQWVSNTISHNTVVVDAKKQDTLNHTAKPLHFDDSGVVKLMDTDVPDAYNATDIYRRTLVMVKLSENESYGVDFFRVKGGDDHIYSFHSQSEEVTLPEETLILQEKGTYAGENVEWGDESTAYDNGFSWMDNVRRVENPSGEFSADFKIKDFKKKLKTNPKLGLKFTMLNDFDLTEVAIVDGMVPRTKDNLRANMDHFEYILARRKGENLDSLFTTVYEPYKDNSKIASIEAVEIIGDGTETSDDVAKAVLVKNNEGRLDYIVYATDNTVTYTVDNKFTFRGFVGVYMCDEEGNEIYKYVNDGDLIAGLGGTAAITGTVTDFTKGYVSKNTISAKLDAPIDATILSDKYVYIENDGLQNAVYRIASATCDEEGNAVFDIDDVSLARSMVGDEITYNIEAGNTLRIPLKAIENNMPVFAPVSDVTATAVSAISLKVSAKSADGGAVIYSADLPRGASLDATTGEFKWNPSSSQIGENVVRIYAYDGAAVSSTDIIITVYGSTTGGSGGGGGEISAPTKSETPDVPEEPEIPTVPETPGTGNARFIDLENHAWAEDAINALADEGVIRGTSENTFSPAANITRADFALLLVRAFELESDNTENFADVADSDYFAKELAIARNTGIVNGIGDNKYAPKNTITRQDMMVIVYRALEKMGKISVGEDIILPQHPDFDIVSDYAQDAVKALITSGLVNGKNGLIAPTDYTTRAEVAVLIKRILDYTK
ncbi:MAG: S-layer homology domain-containing protein [Oscillospiraceae bacterium]|nr:S-layer homology domain-containing protein [Oscillospiraceae bacterium]